jgi:hypothetical protein
MVPSCRFAFIQFFNCTPYRKLLQLTPIFDRPIVFIMYQLFLLRAVFEEMDKSYKYLTFPR